MHRRLFLSALASSLGVAAFPGLADAAKQSRQRQRYQGAEFVYFDSYEEPGTIIIDTGKRALYYILSDSEAVRYGVAVGKDGFSWAGIAKIGRKTEWPRWTPPSSMIKRKPELAKFANGMPGGPDNPPGCPCALSLRQWPRHVVPHPRHQRAAIDRHRRLFRLHPHAQ
jgi:lipoprotein-anchoring transpeptidase ErfK/SrfK